MRGFRDRRIVLLVLALLISALFITSPWKEPQPEGAPMGDVVRGPNWGIDITGGSRIMLRLEAKEATVRISPPPEDLEEVGSFITGLEDELRLDVELIGRGGGENIVQTGVGTFLLKESVTRDTFVSALDNNVELVDGSFKDADFSTGRPNQIREELMDTLKRRVDPQGTLGAQFRPIGSRFIMYEVSLDPDEARNLLGHTGRLEMYVDNTLVLWGRHIGKVETIQSDPDMGVFLPFNLVENGPRRWADLTAGKEGVPGVIYLDRPDDSVLLMPDSLVDQLQQTNLTYDSDAHRLNVIFPGVQTQKEFYLQVPAVEVDTGSATPISGDSREFLEANSGRYSQAIWLGQKDDFPGGLLRNGELVLDNQAGYSVEYIPRQNEDEETVFEWVANRVCGYRSSPTISDNVAGRELTSLSITNLGSREEATNLKTILSQSLSVGISPISAERVDRRLSGNFLQEALIAGLAAFAVVGILVYTFYKRFKIVVPLLVTMVSEVIITLGAASIIPDAFMSIGLPGLGGLIAVVGTGVDHQIIIADEVLEEKTSSKGKLPIDRRTGRAFAVIFSAAATTVAAMIALAIFGFGPMRGFALVTLFGVLVSVLITRPAFARIIGILMEREESEKK